MRHAGFENLFFKRDAAHSGNRRKVQLQSNAFRRDMELEIVVLSCRLDEKLADVAGCPGPFIVDLCSVEDIAVMKERVNAERILFGGQCRASPLLAGLAGLVIAEPEYFPGMNCFRVLSRMRSFFQGII